MLSITKSKSTYLYLVGLLAITTFGGCRATNSSQIKTDLGPVGNSAVVDQFKRYRDKTVHCDDSGSGTRVLLTGFGLFSSSPLNAQGRPYNISGLVTRFMAEPAVFPQSVNTATATAPHTIANGLYATMSHMPANAHGGHAAQRELIIDQNTVTVCFLLLDVIWDQAAAIILYEASRFKPDRIIMSGLNGNQSKVGLFEAGAINSAMTYSGFSADGSAATNNLPVATPQGDPPILDPNQPGVENPIAMTWDAKALAQITQPIAQRIPTGLFGQRFSVRGETDARPTNEYICNNVSFVVLHAAKGTTVDLAGGRLRLGNASQQPAAGSDIDFVALDGTVMSNIKSIGFFHFPNTKNDRGNAVFGWSLVLAKAMIAEL